MGFFDTFDDIWKDGWTWKKVGESFSHAGSDLKNSGRSLVSGLWDTIRATATLDGDARRSAISHYVDFGKNLGSGLGNALSGVTEVPLLNQTFRTLDTFQNEAVRRPIATYNLVLGDALRGKGSFFNGGAWRQAYNDSRHVSAGQAFIYDMSAAVDPFTDTELDPRTAEGQRNYHDNGLMKWSSGAADVASLFLDPTVMGAKLTMAGKLKYVSKVMNGSAIKRGEDVKFISSGRRNELFDFYRNKINDPDIGHQTIFNKVQGGGIANRVLFDAAKVENVDEANDLFNKSLMYMWGDENALQEIAQKAPHIARNIGDMRPGAGFGSVAKDFPTGNPALDAVVKARAETDTQAFLSEVANGASLYSKAGGILARKAQPRLTLTSRARVSVHQSVVGTRATFIGKAVNRYGRYALPSSTHTRVISLEDPGPTSIEKIRANWEGSRVLPQDQLSEHVQRYAVAKNSDERHLAFQEGENAIFRAIAAKYKFSEQDANNAIQRINSMRLANRQAFSSSRRYMSTEVQKMAQQLWDEAQFKEAAHLRQLGDEIKAGAARGEVSDAYLRYHEPDGHLVLLPEQLNKDGSRFTVGDSPISPTQHADYVAAMDWKLLHQALWWEKHGPIGQKTYKVIDESRALLDAVSSVWKVGMLLRPGYTWRMLTDENGRALALMGAGPTFAAMVKGAANFASNTRSRGRIAHQAFEDWRGARALNDTDIADNVVEVESGAVATDLAAAHPRMEDDPVPTRERSFGEMVNDVMARYETRPEDLPANVVKAIEDHRINGIKYQRMAVKEELKNNGIPDWVEKAAPLTGPDGKPLKRRSRKVVQHYDDLNGGLADGLVDPATFVAAARSAFDERPRSVPAELAAILNDHRMGKTDPTRDVLEWSLTQAGRNTFTEPKWRRDFLDQLAESRVSLVDPFSGTAPADKAVMPITSIGNVRRLNPGDELAGFEDYVFENADELLKPNSMLHAQMTKDGFAELSIAKMNPVDVTKPTGGRRVKFLGKEFDYRQTGADRLEINTPNGAMTINHSFGGEDGPRLKFQSSSREDGMSWTERTIDKRYQELMQESRDMWRDVSPLEPHYGPSWERVVNNQLGNDAVARRVLLGESDDQIVAWLRKDPKGQEYLRRLGPWQRYYWAQVAAMRQMVEMYVPKFADGSEASKLLRDKVLARNAEYEAHLKTVIPDPQDMPMIHGTAIEAATMSGKWSQRINKWVDNTFKVIADKPADRLARFPFAAERYKIHAQGLSDVYFAQAAKNGYDSISADVLYRIQSQARERTAADVKKYLYDAATQHDAARMARLFVPFGSAAMDSFSKWGVISREKPWVPYNLWKWATAPDRGGYTTDEAGNEKRYINGDWRWVAFDPTTKQERVLPKEYSPEQEYVTLQLAADLLPSSLAGEVDGVKFAPRANKKTFDTFLATPTAGPLVSIPANIFGLDHPEFAENKLVSRFILPIGTRTNTADMFMPGWIKTAYSLAVNGPDGDLAKSQAIAIYQTEMVRKQLGERAQPPTLQEAREKAASLVGLRMMYQLSGLTPAWVGPYQPYLDYYHQLMAEDPSTAEAKFHETSGDEYFALTMHVSKNLSGIPATIKSHQAYKKYQDLIEQFPDLGGLITGQDGGEFSSGVYNWQLEQAQSPGSDERMRKRMSLEESVEDNAIRLGWIKYTKLQSMIDAELLDRGLTSIQQRGAEDLRTAKQKFLKREMYWNQSPNGGKQLNPWFTDYSTVDRSRVTARLNGMSQIINDPRLRQRDEIRGIADYLRQRQRMKQMMEAEGFASLGSQEATNYRNSWNAFVMKLKDTNLSFAKVHDRYLAGDEFLQANL